MNDDRKSKQPTSIRFSEDTKSLLKALATHLDCSEHDVLVRAIRELARREKIR